MSLGSFEIDIQRFVDRAKGNVNLVIRKIALDLFTRVIMKSPVLTGRFRGNWQIAIGSIPSGTLEIDDKGGTATISKVTATTLGLVAGQVITLVNNLTYAQSLEFGHSRQAPNGMVRLTLLEYPQVVRTAASAVSQ